MGVRKLVKRIAENGCHGVDCGNDGCPFCDGEACGAYRDSIGVRSKEVMAQAAQWLKDHPKKVKEQPEWDGKFVPGKFYTNTGGLVVLCSSDDTPSRFAGVVINTDWHWKGKEGRYCDSWVKECFCPCEVEIKVKQ